MRKSATHAEIRDYVVNEYTKKHPKAFHNLEDGVKGLIEEFIKAKLYDFPKLCQETRRVNYLKQKEFRAMDNPHGWSPSKDFKFDYVIPRELYLFMTNMVYRNFWAEENEKIWRKFMQRIMAGYDSMEELKRLKIYYGSVSAMS